MKEIEALRAEQREILSELQKLKAVMLGEKRDLNEEERGKWEELSARSDEIDSMCERLSKIAKIEKDSDSVEETVKLSVTREEHHNEEGEARVYKHIGEQLADIAKYSTKRILSKKLEKVQLAATGANNAVGSDGAFMLQTDFQTMMFDNTREQSNIASECTLINTNQAQLELTLVDETSRATGSRFGGVQAYWREEAGTPTSTKPKFRKEMIKPEALEALYYATEEHLEDTDYLSSFVAPAFIEEMAWILDDAIIGGNGAGKPLGILNAPGTITIAKEGGQSADTVVYANINKMNDRLLVTAENGARWYHHKDVLKQARDMVHTPGSLTDFNPFMPANQAFKTPRMLLDYEMKTIEQARALGDLGDIILGNFKYYALVRRTGIKAADSMHVAFLTSEHVFKWTMRVNGQPIHNSPITDAYGSTTRSAFVVLAERA